MTKQFFITEEFIKTNYPKCKCIVFDMPVAIINKVASSAKFMTFDSIKEFEEKYHNELFSGCGALIFQNYPYPNSSLKSFIEDCVDESIQLGNRGPLTDEEIVEIDKHKIEIVDDINIADDIRIRIFEI